MRLVGSGSQSYQESLVRLAVRLGVQDQVSFLGRLTLRDKHRAMAEAHSVLMTSVREGWGLVITEASACGTPAIVYNVPGLRDAVRHDVTGLVVPPNPQSLRDAMTRLVSDRGLYARLAAEGRRWSATFSFDDAVQLVSETLEGRLAA